MTLRIVQWCAGNVGRACIETTLDRNDLELVGLYVYGEDKVGKDAGELIGRDPVGIRATSDIGEIIALKPDCVMYAPYLPNIGHMEELLHAGINIVTTSNFIRGDYLGRFGLTDARERMDAAAKKGGVSVYSGGYNPGFVTSMPVYLASLARRVDSIDIYEAGDVGHYDSSMFFEMIGWGKNPEELTDQNRTAMDAMDGFLYDALDVIADAVGFEITDRRKLVDYAVTQERIEKPAMTFEPGTIAGQRTRWEYLSGDKCVMSVNITWWISGKLEPDYGSEEKENDGVHRYFINGDPDIDATTKLRSHDRQDEYDSKDGVTGTAMHAFNAIPVVCAARPGLLTYLDIPPYAGMAARCFAS